MAEEFSSALDFKKALSKNKGEEEPIVIAQRFLNIFKQLHIFNEEKRKSFSDMILSLPPEIRGMFGNLPGGSLLQEYVDDLEQKAGIIRDRSQISPSLTPDMHEELSKAKILATALAEAQIKAGTAIPQAAPQPSAAPQGQRTATAPLLSGAATLTADASFAKQIADAITRAIEATDNNRKQETAAITKAITDSQMQIAKLFLQHSSGIPTSSGGVLVDNSEVVAKAIGDSQKELAKMFLEYQNGHSGNSSDIGKAISASQMELVKLFQEQNQIQKNNMEELTKAINASQQNLAQRFLEYSEKTNQRAQSADNEALNAVTKALTDSQKQMAKFMLLNNSEMAPADRQALSTVDYTADITKAMTAALTESQMQVAKMLSQNNASNNASNNSGHNININTAPGATPNTEDLLAGIVKIQSELFKNISRAQTDELSSVITLALNKSQQVSTQSIIDTIKALHNNRDYQPVAANQLQVSAPQETPVSCSILEESGDSTLEILRNSKKKKNKNKNKNRFNDTPLSAQAESEDLPINLDEEFDANPFPPSYTKGLTAQPLSLSTPQNTPISSTGLDTSLFDFDDNQASDPLPLTDVVPLNLDETESPFSSSNKVELPAPPQSESSVINSEEFEKDATAALDIFSENEEEIDLSDDDFHFDTALEPTSESTNVKQENHPYIKSDFEEVSTASNQSFLKAEEPTSLLSSEEDFNIPDAVTEAENLPENAQTDDGEWEYEEVEDDGASADGEEGEWEYVEVDEDGNPIEATDDEDGEWEYVEVDEDGNPIEPTGDEDGEWEWEYEEVDEDGNPVEPQEG